jgi:GxxExxY protein
MSTHESGLPAAEDAKDSQRTQKDSQRREDDFSHDIIGAAVEVQRVLGVGLLESAYAGAFTVELEKRNLRYRKEVVIPAVYKGVEVGPAFRADFIVEDTVIVELKATEGLTDVHRAQLLSYLRLSGLKLGLLINFHTFPIVKGVHRMVNKL